MPEHTVQILKEEMGVASRLKFDSLEVVDIIMAIEDHLRVEVSDEAAA